MASIAPDFGLTLAPTHPLYAGHEVALLANSYFSAKSQPVEDAVLEWDEPAMPTAIPMPDRQQFDLALAQWTEDMAFDSFPEQMKDHDSFREIIDQGARVVPLIAASLRRTPSFLFLALEEIFNEDPVPEDSYGNLQATVSSWLQWLQR